MANFFGWVWAVRGNPQVIGGRAPNSEKSWDVLDREGRRLQVKSRVFDHTQVGSNTTSPFRSWDFHAAVIVLLNPEDLAVGRATELPVDVVRDNASSRPHVNGYVLRPNAAPMGLGIDVTNPLRAAARAV